MSEGFIKSPTEPQCEEIELFFCPFCGGIPELVDRPHGSCVRCPNCGAMIARDLYPEIQDTKQAVIKAWNSRIFAEKIIDYAKPCLLCDYDEPGVYSEGDMFYVQCSYCGTKTYPYKTQREAVTAWNNGRLCDE